MALGPHSPILLRPIGLNLPIWPVKGYTASIPIDGHAGAPKVGIIEEDNLVAFANLGDTLRIGGKAEFTRYDTSYSGGGLPRRDGGLERTLSECRRLQPAAVLGLPAAGKCRRTADHRRDPHRQPFPQCRTRCGGLDGGMCDEPRCRRYRRTAASRLSTWRVSGCRIFSSEPKTALDQLRFDGDVPVRCARVGTNLVGGLDQALRRRRAPSPAGSHRGEQPG